MSSPGQRPDGAGGAGARTRSIDRVLGMLWVSMMLAWMGGLAFGVWWTWPHIQRLALTADLVVSVMWLVIGAAAWGVALNLGYRRFWTR
jgi:hypothetical protein